MMTFTVHCYFFLHFTYERFETRPELNAICPRLVRTIYFNEKIITPVVKGLYLRRKRAHPRISSVYKICGMQPAFKQHVTLLNDASFLAQ